MCHSAHPCKLSPAQTGHRMGENTTSYISDSGLISRIYNQLQELNSKKIEFPINNWANEMNRQFSIKTTTTKRNGRKLFHKVFNIQSHRGNAH